MKTALLIAAFLAAAPYGCGNSSSTTPKLPASSLSSTSTDTGAGTPDTFAFDQKTEDALDASALDDAGAGYAVVSLYFGGGTAAACAKWNVVITGADVLLSDAKKLDSDIQKLVKDDGSGTVSGAFQTHGKKPGIRVLAKGDAKLDVKGKQSFCKTSDETDFDVSITVQSHALKDEFTGVDSGDAQANLRARISSTKTKVASTGTTTATGTDAGTGTGTDTGTSTSTSTNTSTGTGTMTTSSTGTGTGTAH